MKVEHHKGDLPFLAESLLKLTQLLLSRSPDHEKDMSELQKLEKELSYYVVSGITPIEPQEQSKELKG